MLLQRPKHSLLRHRRRPLDIAATLAQLAPGAAAVSEALPTLLGPAERERARGEAAELTAAGIPPALAKQVAHLEALVPTLDIVEIAASVGLDAATAAQICIGLGARLGPDWLRDHAFESGRSAGVAGRP